MEKSDQPSPTAVDDQATPPDQAESVDDDRLMAEDRSSENIPEDESPRPVIVAIGASAGGLEALTAVLKRLSLGGMAVIIVQHRPPHQESVLPALLSKATGHHVVPAEDGQAVQPNHVYVIPPNADLAILRGVLHLMAPPTTSPSGHTRPRLPIDYFMRSLAEDQGSRAVGVILSGMGTDGTFGLKAIKEVGGITFAQDLDSARYDGMPQSASESGWADFTLAPEAIADELMEVSRNPYLVRNRAPSAPAQEHISKLILLMRTAFGNDLTYYKPATIDRRIARRMALHKVEKIADYVKFVQSTSDELRLLYKDMLIGVTSFFRDPDSFVALKDKVFPHIMETKEPGGQLRIWVPACASGEEAYSLAMLLLEFLGDRAPDFRLQIFGTDVDESAIAFARRGVYPPNIALDVSVDRLQRFFIKRDNDYQVCRRIRDMVVFSGQNATKDAPFSRLDLASCRNLLIYLRPQIQKKVLRILHYSLLPGGYLILGGSETVGDSSELFSLLDRKNKIYGKKTGASVPALDLGFGTRNVDAIQAIDTVASHRTSANLATLAERKILDLYAPPGVVINDDMEVIHIRGRTGTFLEPMPGAPSFNLLRLARPDLHVDLRRIIREAKAQNTRVVASSRVTEGGHVHAVQIEAVPLVEPERKTRCLLILFHMAPPSPREVEPSPSHPGAPASPDDERLREMERELLVTKEYLQSAIEELESTNEELKSSNEELQSANEELQSTNEELETSKEELQSSNEELTTVNDELQNRMVDLQQINDDLHNILGGIGDAIVIIGLDLRIRRFTQTAETLLNLVPGDVGRSVSQLNAFIIGHRIEEIAARVIERLTPVKEKIPCANQRWYELNVTPYKTLDHAIKGAVIILVDVDARRRGEHEPEE